MDKVNNITEIDADKYIVIKRDDANKMSEEFKASLESIIRAIDTIRADSGKERSQYLVLNMDDEIDVGHWSPISKQMANIQKKHCVPMRAPKTHSRCKYYSHDGKADHVKDIAPSLVNAILNVNKWVNHGRKEPE